MIKLLFFNQSLMSIHKTHHTYNIALTKKQFENIYLKKFSSAASIVIVAGALVLWPPATSRALCLKSSILMSKPYNMESFDNQRVWLSCPGVCQKPFGLWSSLWQ
jgi:hypothetical protein